MHKVGSCHISIIIYEEKRVLTQNKHHKTPFTKKIYGLYFLSGQVHPDCWIISVAAQIPQATQFVMVLPKANWAKNPPTKASPAPLVSKNEIKCVRTA